MGGPEYPGRRGLEVKVSLGTVDSGQESDGDILVLERVTQGPQRLPPATEQSRQELGVPAEPCAKPELRPVLPSGMVWSISASFSSILHSRCGSSRHVQAAARQELPGGAGPILGPFPRSHSRVPSQLPHSAGSPGRLGGGWWMLGAQRFFMVSEGSINSLNIQPFQVGFVEN